MSDKFLDWVGITPFVEIKIANISRNHVLIEVDSKFVEDNGNGITSSVKTSKCILNSDNNKELLEIIEQLYDISKKGGSNDCGEALQQCDADRHTEPITLEIYPFTEHGERLNKALKPLEEAAKIYETYKDFDEIQQKIGKTNYVSKLQKELHEKRNNLDYRLCLCMQACTDLAESCGIDLGIKFKKYDKE